MAISSAGHSETAEKLGFPAVCFLQPLQLIQRRPAAAMIDQESCSRSFTDELELRFNLFQVPAAFEHRVLLCLPSVSELSVAYDVA